MTFLPKVCGYQPGGLLPYNHLIWADSKERLVEVRVIIIDNNDEGICDNSSQDNERPEIMISVTSSSSQASLQLLIVCLDQENESGGNLFLSYLSRSEYNFLPNNRIMIILITIMISRLQIA